MYRVRMPGKPQRETLVKMSIDSLQALEGARSEDL
jgi:hypothetical protein